MVNRTWLFKRFPRDLVELRETELDRERVLHDMVEQNIGVLFPKLVVLRREFERDGLRADTVAFDEKRNTFVIIEYKNRRDDKALVQASAYLANMDEFKDSFWRLYFDKTGDAGTAKFDWDGAYAIILAPEFTKMQIKAAQAIPSLTLYAVSVYEDGIISLTRVAGDERRPEDNVRKGDTVPASAPKPAAPLYEAIRGRLLDEFPGAEVNEKPKYYNGFRYPGKAYFCTVEVQKRKIWMWYPDKSVAIENEADFERELAKMKKLLAGTPDAGAKVEGGMDRLYSAARAELRLAFPRMAEKKTMHYDKFEVGGQRLCTMGKQRSKIWLYYHGCTVNPAPDQPEFVEVAKKASWGLGRWRSAIRSRADFDRALSILKGLHGRR